MVDCKEQYENLYREVEDHDLILEIVPSDPDCHAAFCHPLAIFIYDTITHKDYTVSFSHPDVSFKVARNDINHRFNKQKNRLWTLDKKSFIQTLPMVEMYDINLLRFIKNNSVTEFNYTTNAHNFIKRLHPNRGNLGRTIPLVKHKEIFDKIVENTLETVQNATTDDSYDKINTIVIETLAELESNGIYVNKPCFRKHFGAKVYPYKGSPHQHVVYSQYNIYTSTGRPSNRFDGVNYAALNKENGCRKCFVSRFGYDWHTENEKPVITKRHGKILLIDYSAFHPRIISHLTGFDIPNDTDIYQYLGNLYFNKQNLTPLDIDEAKKLTFRQLYGGVEKPYEHIKYFHHLKGFVEDNWKFFRQHGYVETPIFKRKITENHIQDPNPNKLFNYILQATETEITIPVIQKLNNFLRSKQTKTVLYTYDSLLFDFYRCDGINTLKQIVEIMKMDNRFPVKIYIGDDYDDLHQITVS